MCIETYNGSLLARNIKNIMNEKGLKQKAVAHKAGFSEKEFSAMLNNQKIIKVDEVMNIAKALDVTPNELYGIETKGVKGRMV